LDIIGKIPFFIYYVLIPSDKLFHQMDMDWFTRAFFYISYPFLSLTAIFLGTRTRNLNSYKCNSRNKLSLHQMLKLQRLID